MKVCTDSVLLGAWCSVKAAKTALDIGTGTGLLALMLAQRNSNLKIDAVEISAEGAAEALLNVQNSKFKDSIRIFNCSVQDFAAAAKQAGTANKYSSTGLNYDLIVCNPPYFENSLKNSDKQSSMVRHNVSLSYTELFLCVDKLIGNKGLFSLIIPAQKAGNIIEIANSVNLYLIRKTDIMTTPNSGIKRCLLEFSKNKQQPKLDNLTIEFSSNNYTPEYKELTKEFYLESV